MGFLVGFSPKWWKLSLPEIELFKLKYLRVFNSCLNKADGPGGKPAKLEEKKV